MRDARRDAIGSVRTGTSGWAYRRWRGDFYPRGLAQRQELAYAAGHLRTLEANAPFYSLRQPSTYLRWRDETPSDTVIAVKGGRFITHVKRLVEVRQPLANFFASGVLALGDRLGPVLWQLPDNLAYDEALLHRFLGSLPRDTTAAKRQGREHGEQVAGRTWLERGPVRPLRYAVEARHPSFSAPAWLELLSRFGISAVVSDNPVGWPRFGEVTSDLVYVRCHGPHDLYRGGYSRRELDRWAARAREWASGGLDVLIYFNNDADGRAPYDAVLLQQLVDGNGRSR